MLVVFWNGTVAVVVVVVVVVGGGGGACLAITDLALLITDK